MKNVLITGSSGFIGTNIVARIMSEKKLNPVCFDISLGNADNIFQTIGPNYDKIDRVVHLGAISDKSCTDISKLYEYNLNYSIRLLETAIKYDIPIINASSFSVYGNSGGYSYDCLDYYSLFKLAVDHWIEKQISKNPKTKVVSYRLPNVYGQYEGMKSQRTRSIVNNFITQIAETGRIKVFNLYIRDCEHVYTTVERNFVCVDDVVTYMLEPITENTHFGVVDFCEPDITYNIVEVAKKIANKFGYTNDVIDVVNPPDYIDTKTYQHRSVDVLSNASQFKYTTLYDWIDALPVT